MYSQNLLLFSLVLTVLLFVALFVAQKRNKARLLGGYLFCAFFVSAALTYLFFALQTDSPFFNFTLVIAAVAVAVALAFGLYILVAFLLLNARLMAKRERHSLQNRLTLLVALGIILFLILSSVLSRVGVPAWLRVVWSGIITLTIYYFLHVLVFLLSVLLCNLARPPKKQDYIIVLGSGLVNGGVSPLLARRIDRAMAFYAKQAKKRQPPKLVLSGGQGKGEPLPEAAAMKKYALLRGIPEEMILEEARSASTQQNMAFSRQVMRADFGGEGYRCIYATSNYHLLRAGIYARQSGLSIDGLGAKTAPYYLPSALLREYAAYLVMYKKRMMIAALVSLLLGVGLGLANLWLAVPPV